MSGQRRIEDCNFVGSSLDDPNPPTFRYDFESGDLDMRGWVLYPKSEDRFRCHLRRAILSRYYRAKNALRRGTRRSDA